MGDDIEEVGSGLCIFWDIVNILTSILSGDLSQSSGVAPCLFQVTIVSWVVFGNPVPTAALILYFDRGRHRGGPQTMKSGQDELAGKSLCFFRVSGQGRPTRSETSPNFSRELCIQQPAQIGNKNTSSLVQFR